MATTTPTRGFFGSISISLRSRTRWSKDSKKKSNNHLYQSSNRSMPNLTTTSSASHSTAMSIHLPLATTSTPFSRPPVSPVPSLLPPLHSDSLSPTISSLSFPPTDIAPPSPPPPPSIQNSPTTAASASSSFCPESSPDSVADRKRKEGCPKRKSKDKKSNLPQAITTVTTIIGSLFSPSIATTNSTPLSLHTATTTSRTTNSTQGDKMAKNPIPVLHPSSQHKGLSELGHLNSSSRGRAAATTTTEATAVQDEKLDWTDDEDDSNDRSQGLETMAKKRGLFFRKGFRFSRNTSSNSSTTSLGSFLSTQSAKFLNTKAPSKAIPNPTTIAAVSPSSSSLSLLSKNMMQKSSSLPFLSKNMKQKQRRTSTVAPLPLPQCPRMGGEYEEVFNHGDSSPPPPPIVPQISDSQALFLPRPPASPTPPTHQVERIVVDINSKGKELCLPLTVCIQSLPPPPLSSPPPRPGQVDNNEEDDDDDEDEFGMDAKRNEVYAQTRLRALREHQMVLVELMTLLMERELFASHGSRDPRRSTRSGKRLSNAATVGSPTPSERYSLMSTTLISSDDLILLNSEIFQEDARVLDGNPGGGEGRKGGALPSSLSPCKCQLRRIRRRQKREEAARVYLAMVLDLWQLDQNMCHWLSRYIRTIRRVHRSLEYIKSCVALSKAGSGTTDEEERPLREGDLVSDCDLAKGSVTMDELERVGILQTNLLNRIFPRSKAAATTAATVTAANAAAERFGVDSETVLPQEDERQRVETIARQDRRRQQQLQDDGTLPNASTSSRLRRSIRIPRSRSRKLTSTTPTTMVTPTVDIPVPVMSPAFTSPSTAIQTTPPASLAADPLPSPEAASFAFSKPLPPLPPVIASSAAAAPFSHSAFVTLDDESSPWCMITRSPSPSPSPSISSSPSEWQLPPMPALVPLVIQSPTAATTDVESSASSKDAATLTADTPAALSPPGLIVTSPTIVRRGKSKKLRNGLPFSSSNRWRPTLRRYHQQQILFPTPTMRSQFGGGLGDSSSSEALTKEGSSPLSEIELSVLVGHHLQTLHAAHRFLDEFNQQSRNASSVMAQFWRAKEVYEQWLALFSRKKRQSSQTPSLLQQQQQQQQHDHLQQQWQRRRQERLSLQHQQLQEKQAQQQLRVQQHQVKLLQQYRELQEQQLQEQILQQHLQHLRQQQQQQHQQGGLARRFTRRYRRATLMATKNIHGGTRSSRSTIMTTKTSTTTTATRRTRQKPFKTNMTSETKK